jgi:deoxyribonuclease I
LPQARTTKQTGQGAQDGEIHGNKRSKIYHLSHCPDYQDVSATNLVTFQSEAEAVQAGYHKAKNCR